MPTDPRIVVHKDSLFIGKVLGTYLAPEVDPKTREPIPGTNKGDVVVAIWDEFSSAYKRAPADWRAGEFREATEEERKQVE